MGNWDNMMAFRGHDEFYDMEDLHKAFEDGRKQGWREAMEEHDVPQWYIDSMKRITYLFCKSHLVAFVKLYFSLAWFKCYYPKEFYTVTLQDLGAEEFLHYSNEALLQKLETMERCDHYKDKPQEAIELLLEARRRNIPLKL